MKKLSETLKEKGIATKLPIEIKDEDGNQTCGEDRYGYGWRHEYDLEGNQTYFEDSEGIKTGTPRASKTCEGTVVEIDGVKYELKTIN